MTTFIEPLPGLLDDPLLHLPDLPPRADVRIPPLRDPFPSRALTVPSPLEPNAPGDKQIQGAVKLGSSKNVSKSQRTTPKITPADVISARDTKKPDIAISALVDSGSTNQLPRLLPPSFVNLAAVENNSSSQSWLPECPPPKRMKLDQDYHAEYLQLPKPRQKETSKRVPLLPTIVNGIHEPPPNAALLPPMELEEVKAMLAGISEPVLLPPEKMLNPAEPEGQVPISQDKLKPLDTTAEVARAKDQPPSPPSKPPRTWKKWSDEETQHLLKGVAKHGAGKWKEICADSEFKFRDRRPMDLKDRFRICFPGTGKEKNGDTSSNNMGSVFPHGPEYTPNDHTSTGPTNITQSDSLAPRDPSQDRHVPSASSNVSMTVPAILQTPSADIAAVIKSRSNQRIRKLWTEEEHQNLVRGFAKHGYQWTTIRNDSELNLSHRKATDIRDKFRSLFPQQYMEAESGPPISSRKPSNNNAHVKVPKNKNNNTLPKRSSNASILSVNAHLNHAPILNHNTNSKSPLMPTTSSSLPLLTPLKHPPHPTPLPAAPPGSSTTPSRPDRTDRLPQISTPSSHEKPAENATVVVPSIPNLTLPPLTLGDNDWDWDDNKLAPLLEWDAEGGEAEAVGQGVGVGAGVEFVL